VGGAPACVSIDVVTIDVAGLQEGQHLDGAPTLTFRRATTRRRRGLDEHRPRRPDGGVGLAWHAWRGPGRSPRSARAGRVLEIRATNQRGEVSTVASSLTGDTFMTQVGSRFADAHELSLRDLTRPAARTWSRSDIFAAAATGTADPAKRVIQHETAAPRARCAASGTVATRVAGPAGGKYVGEAVVQGCRGQVAPDRAGRPSLTPARPRSGATTGQVQGRLHLAGGAAAENAEVRTRRTSAGSRRRSHRAAAVEGDGNVDAARDELGPRAFSAAGAARQVQPALDLAVVAPAARPRWRATKATCSVWRTWPAASLYDSFATYSARRLALATWSRPFHWKRIAPGRPRSRC